MGKLAAIALISLAADFVLAQQKSVWDGIYTEEQANRGKQVYADMCASCHDAKRAARWRRRLSAMTSWLTSMV